MDISHSVNTCAHVNSKLSVKLVINVTPAKTEY